MQSEDKLNQINLNTWGIGFVSVLLLVIGFLMQHTLKGIEDTQKAIRRDMMPRHEIELQIEQLKSQYVELKQRMLVLERRLK